MSGDWTVLDWFVSLTLVTWWQCGVYTPFLFNVQQAWSVVLQLVRCYCAPCSCWRPPCCLFFPGPVTQWVFLKLYLRWDNYEWTPCNWELSLHCCSKVHLPIDGVKLVLYIHEQPLGLLARAWVNVWWSVIFLSGCRRNNPPKHNWVFSWTKSLLALCSALCSSDITVPAAVRPPKSPSAGWCITFHGNSHFYDTSWRRQRLCCGWKTLNCQTLVGAPFIYFYLDDLFPTEAQKDQAE